MSGHRKSDVEPGQLPARRVAHVHAHTRVLHDKLRQRPLAAKALLAGPANTSSVAGAIRALSHSQTTLHAMLTASQAARPQPKATSRIRASAENLAVTHRAECRILDHPGRRPRRRRGNGKMQ